ncbi:MAG: hypothetical protein ACE5G0_17215 [Rhodothermales bacterium]
MWKRRGYITIVVCCLLSLAWATPGLDWDKLGERTVNHAVDRDEIKVTIKEGTFSKIKFKVKRAKVTFRDVKVHYANGGVQDVQLRRQIPAGGETRVIDLQGDERIITKVVFWYNTRRLLGRRAIVELWGRD